MSAKSSSKQIATEVFNAIVGEYDAQIHDRKFHPTCKLANGQSSCSCQHPKDQGGWNQKTTHRILEDGDIVASHSAYFNSKAMFGGIDTVAIFNVWQVDREAGKFVEQWNNLQPIPLNPNLSGHTMIDGTTDISDANKTVANKEIMTNFIETIVPR